MTFEIDRRCVTEGDVVEITWQCEGAESVTLNINNGFRSTDIPLEISGSKKFRLNRSKGRTHLTLSVVIMGKRHEKKIHVRVKKMPTVHAETVDQQGQHLSIFKQWWMKATDYLRNLRAKTRQSMQTLPEKKQLAVKALTIIGLTLIISAIWPKFYSFALLLITLYLLIVLLKR